MEIKVDLAKMAQGRAEYRKTVPRRIFKGIVGLVVFLPLMLFCFAREAYKQDRWPWYLQ